MQTTLDFFMASPDCIVLVEEETIEDFHPIELTNGAPTARVILFNTPQIYGSSHVRYIDIDRNTNAPIEKKEMTSDEFKKIIENYRINLTQPIHCIQPKDNFSLVHFIEKHGIDFFNLDFINKGLNSSQNKSLEGSVFFQKTLFEFSCKFMKLQQINQLMLLGFHEKQLTPDIIINLSFIQKCNKKNNYFLDIIKKRKPLAIKSAYTIANFFEYSIYSKTFNELIKSQFISQQSDKIIVTERGKQILSLFENPVSGETFYDIFTAFLLDVKNIKKYQSQAIDDFLNRLINLDIPKNEECPEITF